MHTRKPFRKFAEQSYPMYDENNDTIFREVSIEEKQQARGYE